MRLSENKLVLKAGGGDEEEELSRCSGEPLYICSFIIEKEPRHKGGRKHFLTEYFPVSLSSDAFTGERISGSRSLLRDRTLLAWFPPQQAYAASTGTDLYTDLFILWNVQWDKKINAGRVQVPLLVKQSLLEFIGAIFKGYSHKCIYHLSTVINV